MVGTSSPETFSFLLELGAVPVAYGNGLVERLRSAAPGGVDALVDTFGQGNVEAAIQLGVRPDRSNTLADGRAARLYGVPTRAQEDVASAALYQRLARMAAEEQFVLPIEKVYPLDHVRETYRDVGSRHGRGKRILAVAAPDAR